MAKQLSRLDQLMQGKRPADGVWRISDRHELEYRRRGNREELLLKGELLAAEPAGLVARLTERFSDGGFESRVLTLQGRWQADSKNRLLFLVEREGGPADRLTLEGAWQVGENQEILIRLQRLPAGSRSESRLLRFQGAWDFSQGRRLTYLLDRASGSAFRFRGTFQTPSILARTGRIRYQVGVELRGRKRLQTVTLFGKWKISRDLSLEFEMERGRDRRTLTFGSSYAVGPDGTLTARLSARDGSPLGVELLFTRRFLKEQGEAFLRLRRSLEETAFEAGARFRW